jgi:hypothetical protein
MDIDHVEWMMKEALLVCEKENLDDSLLVPLVILHDVGYSAINNVKNVDYYQGDIRKAHMKAGKIITTDILKQLEYPNTKTGQIAKYVSVHDNWSFGEIDLYMNDKILGNFKDLDYIWMFTPKGFSLVQKILGKTNKEMIEYLKTEPSPIGGKKPFSSQTTKRLHDKYLRDRKVDNKVIRS